MPAPASAAAAPNAGRLGQGDGDHTGICCGRRRHWHEPRDAAAEEHTTGWQPGCAHDADIVPCVVLDPFAGAGTTLLVADRLQRDAMGIELNVAYTQMAMDRVRADAPLFADLADAPVPEPPEDARMGDLFEEAAD